MERNKLEKSLLALSLQEGHYGVLNVKSVSDMLEIRDNLIRGYSQIFYEDFLERRKQKNVI